jgi:F-type H+-transporting ATPase subunit delta
MIRTTKQAKSAAKRLFSLCVVDGKLDAARARQIVQAVIESKRRGGLTVLRHFQRLAQLEVARRTAEIESSVPLPADLQANVRTEIEALYGPDLNTLFGLNPALIGGMRVKVGNDVYDGSVQSKLSALAKSFGITDTNGRKAGV